MGSIISAIDDDINHYYFLCEKYNEKPVLLKDSKHFYEPDCYGKHARELELRFRQELEQEKFNK